MVGSSYIWQQQTYGKLLAANLVNPVRRHLAGGRRPGVRPAGPTWGRHWTNTNSEIQLTHLTVLWFRLPLRTRFSAGVFPKACMNTGLTLWVQTNIFICFLNHWAQNEWYSQLINSLRPGDTLMRHWTRSAVVKVMAWANDYLFKLEP